MSQTHKFENRFLSCFLTRREDVDAQVMAHKLLVIHLFHQKGRNVVVATLKKNLQKAKSSKMPNLNPSIQILSSRPVGTQTGEKSHPNVRLSIVPFCQIQNVQNNVCFPQCRIKLALTF